MNGDPSRRRARWFTLAGWAVLAGAYGVAVPVFGTLSPVTWTVTWLGWLGAILGPAYGAYRSRGRTAAAMRWGLCALVAAALLTALGAPVRTADGLYQRHRADFDRLAGEGHALPLRLRLLTVDRQAHSRCTSTHPDHGCAVYLMLGQDWRAENGFGIAYFPVHPDANVAIATAEGDTGTPTRELGNGWWVVE